MDLSKLCVFPFIRAFRVCATLLVLIYFHLPLFFIIPRLFCMRSSLFVMNSRERKPSCRFLLHNISLFGYSDSRASFHLKLHLFVPAIDSKGYFYNSKDLFCINLNKFFTFYESNQIAPLYYKLLYFRYDQCYYIFVSRIAILMEYSIRIGKEFEKPVLEFLNFH